MSSKSPRRLLTVPQTYSHSFTFPHQVDTVILCLNLFRRLSDNQKGHITYVINGVLEEIGLDVLSLKDGKFTTNENQYVKLEFKEVGQRTYAYIGFSGKFWNLGRELDGLDCLDLLYSFYRNLSTHKVLKDIYEEFQVSVSQLDICKDHVGRTVSELAKNYFSVTGKRKNKTSTLANLNPARVVDLPASRGKLEEPQTIYVNLKTEDDKNGKPKKYLVSLKFYDKFKKFKEFYPSTHRYWEWYRLKARSEKKFTRLEVSIKTARECSFISRLFDDSFKTGEIPEESELITSILNHIYNGHKQHSRKKDIRPKVNSGRTLEPVLKEFFQPKGSKRKLKAKCRKGMRYKAMEARELFKRKLKDLIQSNSHNFSIQEIKLITNDVLN